MGEMRVLVVGSSGGLGAALAEGYGARGAKVTGLSRRDHGLDVTDEASIARAFAGLVAPFDRVFVATGALELGGVAPEKSLRALTAEAMVAQFALNAAGPVLVLKHALALMPRAGDCRFAALSARVGSIGDNALGGWFSYRAAKAALNQLLHTAAIEVTRTHPKSVVVALHPGHVATPMSLKYGGALPAVSPDQAARRLIDVLEGLTLADTGGFFDWAGKTVAW
jgi:NAD(P)-dependent dehydrogenase (short-subunit alcohol dehydrogenase family)